MSVTTKAPPTTATVGRRRVLIVGGGYVGMYTALRLQRKLKQAEMIIEVQKKVHEILGIPLRTLADEEDD